MWEVFVLTIVVYTFLCFITRSGDKVSKGLKKPRLPPEPWGLPILGHLPFMGTDPTETLIMWKKRLGPVIFARLGSFPTLILNDAKSIREGLSMAEFAGRPHFKVALEVSDKRGIAFSDGVHNTEQRKFFIKNLSDSRYSLVQKVQEELLLLIDQMKSSVAENNGVIQVNKMFTLTIINSLWSGLMGHGFRTEEEKADISHLLHILQEKLVKADDIMVKAATFLPWLDYLLSFFGLGTARHLATIKEIYTFSEKELEKSLKNYDNEKEHQNIMSHIYRSKVEATTDIQSSFHPKNDTQKFAFGDCFMAGIETIGVSLEWLIHYMTQHPEIQRQFQKEIDDVIGPERRLPNLEDREKMPYTRALLNELLRFSSVEPLAMYRIVEQVKFRSYTIPKNTLVIANLHGAHFDEDVWKDPFNFKPERWLHENDSNGSKNSQLTDSFVAFGSGRRICPGQTFGRDCLFLMAVGLMQNFSVEEIQGAPQVKKIFGLELVPTKFSVKFKSRDNNN